MNKFKVGDRITINIPRDLTYIQHFHGISGTVDRLSGPDYWILLDRSPVQDINNKVPFFFQEQYLIVEEFIEQEIIHEPYYIDLDL